jgi:hypothetical protein
MRATCDALKRESELVPLMEDKALRALTRDGERMDHLGPRLRHLTTPAQCPLESRGLTRRRE